MKEPSIASTPEKGLRPLPELPPITLISQSEIRAAIRRVYTAKVEETDQWYPYCFSSGSTIGPVADAIAMGYSREDLDSIPAEAITGLGCGSPIAFAEIVSGNIVVDLGCGAGMDVFLAAKRASPSGVVIGIDMTEAMIQKARRIAAYYGYTNVEFCLGEMENLPIPDASVDVIISNCAINLALNKLRVLSEIYRVLKPGGSVIISDTAAEELLPESIRSDPESWAQCIGGALLKENYPELITNAGLEKPAIIAESAYIFNNLSRREISSITLVSRKSTTPDSPCFQI